MPTDVDPARQESNSSLLWSWQCLKLNVWHFFWNILKRSESGERVVSCHGMSLCGGGYAFQLLKAWWKQRDRRCNSIVKDVKGCQGYSRILILWHFNINNNSTMLEESIAHHGMYFFDNIMQFCNHIFFNHLYFRWYMFILEWAPLVPFDIVG